VELITLKSFEYIESKPVVNNELGVVHEAIRVKLSGNLSLKNTRLDLASRGVICTSETVWVDVDGSEFFWPLIEK